MLHKLKRIYSWIKLLWNSGWWDYIFLLEVIRHQLKYMEDSWHESLHTGAEKQLKNIKTARILCDRIIEDDYTTAPWRYKELKILCSSEGADGLGTFTVAPYQYGEASKKQDIDLLMKIIGRSLLSWWD